MVRRTIGTGSLTPAGPNPCVGLDQEPRIPHRPAGRPRAAAAYARRVLEWIRPAPPAVQESVRAALVELGCPAEAAAGVARQVTWERDAGQERYCLQGTCVDAGRASSDVGPALARAAADENAEVNDRAARGEAGHAPLWSLPARQPRRR